MTLIFSVKYSQAIASIELKTCITVLLLSFVTWINPVHLIITLLQLIVDIFWYHNCKMVGLPGKSNSKTNKITSMSISALVCGTCPAVTPHSPVLPSSTTQSKSSLFSNSYCPTRQPRSYKVLGWAEYSVMMHGSPVGFANLQVNYRYFKPVYFTNTLSYFNFISWMTKQPWGCQTPRLDVMSLVS